VDISCLKLGFEACHNRSISAWMHDPFEGDDFMKRILSSSLFFVFATFSNTLSFAAPKNFHNHQTNNEIDLKAELTGKDLNKMNDEQLYTEVLSQYQRGDTSLMKRATAMLLKKYKHSPHADNALYILGYNALEKSKFAEGLQYFQKLLREYPASNKAVSAEFAKGVAYRNMHLTDLAQKAFFKVRKKYPGSPESFRAENELKLLVRR
jgi:TolA-binding protein